MARRVPAAMMFILTGGLNHTKEENTPEPVLERGIAAFGELALGVAAGEAWAFLKPHRGQRREHAQHEVLARELGRRPRVAQ